MIKNYDEFVNEGFLQNVLSGIEAGIGAFKAERGAEKAADMEMKKALNSSGSTEYSDEAKMTILVKHLVAKSVWLADGFDWNKISEDEYAADGMKHRIEVIEQIISEMKELMPTF